LFIRMARKEKGFWFGAGYLNSSQPGLTTQQERSISLIKSNLPPLRGVDANFKKYMEIRDDNHADLDRFYNEEHLAARHSWDSSRARDAEYQTIANQLLKMVGRTIGRKKGSNSKVVIGFYMSKKCPCCHDFVAQVDLRRFYCKDYKFYFHRDIMAGENIARIVQE
ncbi:hypothetical protein BGZ49_004022, partial [Haplosporangium sp. Z 27]